MTTTRQKLSPSLLQRPWFGAAVYLAFGILWISGSDRVLALLISDAATLTQYQSYKGYFYVSLTAALAWFLLSQKQYYAKSLRASERALRDTFDYAAAGIAHVSLQGGLLQVNRAFCQMLGFTYAELTQLTFQQLTHPLDLDKDLQALQPLIDGQADEYTLEKRYLRKDGTTLWARLSVAIVRSADSAYFISVIHDISQQRAIRQQLAENELRFRTLLDNTPQIAIQGYNADGTTIYWNKASELIYGYSNEEAIGQNLLDLIIPPPMHKAVGTAMAQMAATGVAVPSEELLLQRKDGSMVAVFSGHAVVKLPDGEPQIYCIDVDLTERKQQAAQLALLANFDAVTQLPNRRNFSHSVDKAIQQAATANGHCTLLLMDLDNFKDINDSFGHSAGDELLLQVSQRLLRCCAPGHILARLGGDEFALLVTAAMTEPRLLQLAQQLMQQLQQPCILTNGSEVMTALSVGISSYPQHGTTSDELLQAADAAMYKVKGSGRNNVAFYSDELTLQARQRVLMEAKLRNALKQQKLQCYYQPQVEISSGRITGAEVLLRWHDQQLGQVSPTVFIALAESCGLIHQLGLWVIRHSCQQLKRWQDEGIAPFSLAINVSAQQFSKGDLLAQLTQVLAETAVPAHLIELEVTESALMLDEQQVVTTMQQLRSLGVRLAIDDFGTGYSSLAYLKRLPLDVLKIDRRFIEHIPQANDDKQIVSAIIALAHTMNFKVLAEGVETAGQLAFLQQQGCDYYQGFYCSKALPAAEFAALWQQHAS